METISLIDKKIFSWCPDIEEEALDQMKTVISFPFVKYSALMPDAHVGAHVPIGSVLACDNVVIPAAVGNDIGCGMAIIKTSIHKDQLRDRVICKQVFDEFKSVIPTGFSHNTTNRMKILSNKYHDNYQEIMDETVGDIYDKCNPIGSDLKNVFFGTLGTLGGGNHFCEMQHDEDGNIWVMLHSGSRNVGNIIYKYFISIASDMNEKWYSEHRNTMSYLPANSDEGKLYIKWMKFAIKFAYLNRLVMLKSVMEVMENIFPNISFITEKSFSDATNNILNISHNFASLEHHFGRNYWIHRKGATLVRSGKTGIVPGSMGTPSYIVTGSGNIPSMTSCSHGAGRKMGRMAFCRTMDGKMSEIEDSLNGVVHSKFSTFQRGKLKGAIDVSEAPGAYKDIEDVMLNQEALVNPVVKLTPLICLKG